MSTLLYSQPYISSTSLESSEEPLSNFVTIESYSDIFDSLSAYLENINCVE